MTKRNIVSLIVVVAVLILTISSGTQTWAQTATESNCNFGMIKGQANGSCQVPIPSGCTVANVPGIEERWVDISKGGQTACQFDEEQSNWTSTIVGTCGTCKTEQCSARFSVMFNCASTMTQPKMQLPNR